MDSNNDLAVKILNEIYQINGNDGTLWIKLIQLINKSESSRIYCMKYLRSTLLISPYNELTVDIIDFICDEGNFETIKLFGNLTEDMLTLLKVNFCASIEVQKMLLYLIQKNALKNGLVGGKDNPYIKFEECYHFLLEKGIEFPNPNLNFSKYNKYLILEHNDTERVFNKENDKEKINQYINCFSSYSHESKGDKIKHDFEKFGNKIKTPFEKGAKKIKNFFESKELKKNITKTFHKGISKIEDSFNKSKHKEKVMNDKYN